MDLTEFLQQIFLTYPPERASSMHEVMETYKSVLASNKKYDYEAALHDLMLNYQYSKLPTIAVINGYLRNHVIRAVTPEIEYRDVLAWKGKYQYVFAYNATEESYFEVKYRLQQKGLTVNDTEQRVYD